MIPAKYQTKRFLAVAASAKIVEPAAFDTTNDQTAVRSAPAAQ